MGLDTTHDCWHGAYSAFMRWREALCEVAGYGALRERDGFGGDKAWPAVESDVLVALLHHSDCDGDLPWELCGDLASRLEELLPALRRKGDGGGHVASYADKTVKFIEGLRRAFAAKENVEFH